MYSMYPKCGNLCGQRGRKRFIASWGLRMSHICPCTPCPSPQGYRSKVESRHFAHHGPLPGTHRQERYLLPSPTHITSSLPLSLPLFISELDYSIAKTVAKPGGANYLVLFTIIAVYTPVIQSAFNNRITPRHSKYFSHPIWPFVGDAQ